MERTYEKGEEVNIYTLDEFIKATRPDWFGHIYLDDVAIAAFEDVLCDCCNAEITQPEDEPHKHVVFCLLDRAWCKKCFERWWKNHA